MKLKFPWRFPREQSKWWIEQFQAADNEQFNLLVRDLFEDLAELVFIILDQVTLNKANFGTLRRYFFTVMIGKGIPSFRDVYFLTDYLRSKYTEEELVSITYSMFHQVVVRYFRKRKPKSNLSAYIEKYLMLDLCDWIAHSVYKEYRQQDLFESYDDEKYYLLSKNNYDIPFRWLKPDNRIFFNKNEAKRMFMLEPQFKDIFYSHTKTQGR